MNNSDWRDPPFNRTPDTVNPVRSLQRDVLLDPDGNPWLRHYYDQQSASRGGSISTFGINPGWVNHQIERLREESALHKARRVLAVIWDTTFHSVPQIELQLEMVRCYVEANSTRLLWDGVIDSVCQSLHPTRIKPCISTMKFVDYVFYYAHDHTHIVFPTINFVNKTSPYWSIPLGAIGRGKTVAILDHGIDTLLKPDQLSAFAAVGKGKKTDPLVYLLAGGVNEVSKAAIGWRMIDGAMRPNNEFRKTCEIMARMFDEGDLRWDANDPEVKEEFFSKMRRLFPQRFYVPAKVRFVEVSAFYAAAKLKFPRELTPQVAKAMVRYHGMNLMRYGVKSFSLEKAKDFLDRYKLEDSSVRVSMAKSVADVVAKKVWKIAVRSYEPPVLAPHLIKAMENVPPRDMPCNHWDFTSRQAHAHEIARRILVDAGIAAQENSELMELIGAKLDQIRDETESQRKRDLANGLKPPRGILFQASYEERERRELIKLKEQRLKKIRSEERRAKWKKKIEVEERRRKRERERKEQRLLEQQQLEQQGHAETGHDGQDQ